MHPRYIGCPTVGANNVRLQYIYNYIYIYVYDDRINYYAYALKKMYISDFFSSY